MILTILAVLIIICIFSLMTIYSRYIGTSGFIVKEYPMFTKTDFELLKKKGKDVYTQLYNKYETVLVIQWHSQL